MITVSIQMVQQGKALGELVYVKKNDEVICKSASIIDFSNCASDADCVKAAKQDFRETALCSAAPNTDALFIVRVNGVIVNVKITTLAEAEYYYNEDAA